jgi:hypothetical protein
MKRQLPQLATRRIGPSGRAALGLLACCPRVPTDVLRVLVGMQHARSVAQLMARLRAAGLAHYEMVRPGPVVGSRPVRLWTLTKAGKAMVAMRGLAPSAKERALLPYGMPERSRDPGRQRDVPLLIITYRVLALVMSNLDQPMRLAAWEHPWFRTRRSSHGRAHHVRLSAAAVLVHRGSGAPPLRLLLLPDVGTVPLASYRTILRGLIELRQAEDATDHKEPLLVVATADPSGSGARAEGWRLLVQHVARRAGERPLLVQLLPYDAGLASDVREGRRPVGQSDELFALLARHPLLTRQQLATLLGTSSARTARLVGQLKNRGWVRALAVADLPRDLDGLASHRLRSMALVELTPGGRREAARRLLLDGPVAVRHHGLIGKAGSRGRLLRHLAHTLGVNAVFVTIVLAARRVTQAGGDDALEEWRSAAACARGRFRPDGYGCYRRGGSRFGFFLEYDRGTERAGEYAAKLAAYCRYRESSQLTRDYDGFPLLLVVTISDVAEARFAHQAYLARQYRTATPLVVFLTTTERIQTHAEGILGPIWCTPGPSPWANERVRVRWLPALGSRGLGPNGWATVQPSSRREVEYPWVTAWGSHG